MKLHPFTERLSQWSFSLEPMEFTLERTESTKEKLALPLPLYTSPSSSSSAPHPTSSFITPNAIRWPFSFRRANLWPLSPSLFLVVLIKEQGREKKWESRDIGRDPEGRENRVFIIQETRLKHHSQDDPFAHYRVFYFYF